MRLAPSHADAASGEPSKHTTTTTTTTTRPPRDFATDVAMVLVRCVYVPAFLQSRPPAPPTRDSASARSFFVGWGGDAESSRHLRPVPQRSPSMPELVSQASSRGGAAMVEAVVAQLQDGWTPLHRAAACGDTAVAACVVAACSGLTQHTSVVNRSIWRRTTDELHATPLDIAALAVRGGW